MNNENIILNRNQVDKKYTWNLEDLYSSIIQWEEEYKSISEKLLELNSFRNTLKDSADNLLNCLESFCQISMVIDRLYVYAHMKLHEDSTKPSSQEMASKADMLAVKFSASTSYISPEILAIPDETIKNFIKENKDLTIYAQFIDDILRNKEHTLSPEIEEVLAKSLDIASSPKDIFTMINDADIKFPDIKDKNGNMVQLTKGKYTLFLENNNQDVRKNAFNAFYETYLKQKNTLASTYYSSVKSDSFYANIRGYNSSAEMALSDSNIPVSVYDNLISTVHSNISLLHRYVKLRKKILGVSELHMYDLYAPLVAEFDKKINYEQAKEIVSKALEPMGTEYVNALNEGYKNGWIDVYENEGKRSGAYSWGTYTSHPYVLLNHNDNVNSMFTLAHEMGHALHSFYTWKNQPYIYSDHKIFVAEVASTVNEALLMQYLLKTTEDIQFKKYLVNYFMEQFRGTLFRQTMFAEFEKIVHDMVDKGEPLSCEILNNIYHDLNKFYFGDDIIIDDYIDIEWARIPHFYNAFYVYQYATGYSAAIDLSEKILKEGKPAVDKYLDFLSKGTSEYPIELLKGAGVNMASKEPIEKAMKVFESLLDQMESFQ